MAVIENRYVQALIDSAENKKEIDKFEEGLNELSKLFTSEEDFRNLLLNPRIAKSEKIEVIKEFLPRYDKKDEVFINFIDLLIEEDRIRLIEEIAKEYTKVNNALKNELFIKIVVAKKLDHGQEKAIAKKYQELYKADSIKYEVEIDESIIGGVKVIVGNKIYDSSVKTQLSQMF